MPYVERWCRHCGKEVAPLGGRLGWAHVVTTSVLPSETHVGLLTPVSHVAEPDDGLGGAA